MCITHYQLKPPITLTGSPFFLRHRIKKYYRDKKIQKVHTPVGEGWGYIENKKERVMRQRGAARGGGVFVNTLILIIIHTLSLTLSLCRNEQFMSHFCSCLCITIIIFISIRQIKIGPTFFFSHKTHK